MAATIGRFCGAGLLKSGNGASLQQVIVVINLIVLNQSQFYVKMLRNCFGIDRKMTLHVVRQQHVSFLMIIRSFSRFSMGNKLKLDECNGQDWYNPIYIVIICVKTFFIGHFHECYVTAHTKNFDIATSIQLVVCIVEQTNNIHHHQLSCFLCAAYDFD